MKWNGKLNKKYTQISIYVAVTAVVIYVLTQLVDGAPQIFSYLMERIRWIVKVIKPIIIGFVIAYLFEPVVMLFQKKLEKRKRYRDKPRKARFHSVIITVLIVAIAIIALISILIYSITKQIRLANMDDIVLLVKTYAKYFTDFINSIIDQLKELNIETQEFQSVITSITRNISVIVTNTLNSTAGSIGSISGVISTLAFSIIIGIWFMIDGTMIVNYLNKVMYALFNNKVNNKVHSFLNDADEVFSGYIRGQLLDAIVMMIMIGLTLSLCGVQFGVVIGILAGFGNLIPYLGPIIAYVATGIVCVINGEFQRMIVAIIILFIIQTIDGNYIGPKLLSNAIEVHPLLVIIFLIFGSAIGGFLGMLLAVPVGALIKLLFVRYIDSRVAKKEQEERQQQVQENEK